MADKVASNYLHLFLERHQVKRFKKGGIIIFQGEEPRHAYIVKSGVVKAYNLSLEGDEKPVSFYEKDSLMPASWVYGRSSSSVYYYEAFSKDVEVYMVQKQEFLDFIKKRPELLYYELSLLMADQLGASLRLNALQHSRASDKLVYTLHYLALTHGQRLSNHQALINLDLTHQDFANLTGLTRETAATELSKLKKTKIIDYGKNKPYTLNIEKLGRMLNDQFIAEIGDSADLA